MGVTVCHHFGVGQRPQDVIGPRFCAEASDQPGTLWITNRRESVDQPAFLPNAGLEEGGDKLRGPERCPHYPQAMNFHMSFSAKFQEYQPKSTSSL